MVSALRLPAFTGFAAAFNSSSTAHTAIHLVRVLVHFMKCSFRGLGQILFYATSHSLAEAFAQFGNFSAHDGDVRRILQSVQIDLHVGQGAISTSYSH